MSAPDYDELREDDRMVVDAPGRKVAVYPNPDGHVVLMLVEDGQELFTAIECDEVDALCGALSRSKKEAKPVADALAAQYSTHEVIQKAKGG